MDKEPQQWNFPVARAALGFLGIAADLAGVTADAASAGLKAYSSGVKDLNTKLAPKPDKK